MKTTIDRPFDCRLAEMRQQGRTRRAQDLRRRADASIARAEQIVAGLACVEAAERLIARRVAELARELAPDIRLARRFYGGCWQVTARLDEMWIEADGCPQRATSEIAFLLDPVRPGRLQLERHVVVRGRELPVERHDAPAGDERALAAFVEQGLLAFAERWLDRAGAARPLAA